MTSHATSAKRAPLPSLEDKSAAPLAPALSEVDPVEAFEGSAAQRIFTALLTAHLHRTGTL